jgi:regulator of protease activity HflC (stomatin/prohibitin superfamily)
MEEMTLMELSPSGKLFAFIGRLKSAMPQSGMKKTKYAVGLLVGLYIAFQLFFVYIKPNEFGIKVVRIGMDRGVHKDIYPSGLNFIVPFGFQQMYVLPKDIQVLELTNYPQNASGSARQLKAVHIQTSDGFFVDVDVSILYRIVDPYKVFTQIGPGTLFEDNGIIPKAEPILKAWLGELTTEEFYNSPLRSRKADTAKDMLNQEINQKGIQIEHVLVRYFNYSSEIQKNIEEKKLKDQLVFKNQAEARAATEEAGLKKVEQEGRVLVDVEMEKGKAYVTLKLAERDLYARKKNAEANLLVKMAEAEKIRLKNDAMKGVGAERMVGLKMADVLNGLEMIVLPSDGAAGINPLDLNKTLRLFDIPRGGAE